MIKIAKLSRDMPRMAKRLGDMMVNDALSMFIDNGMTLDEAFPEVSITYLDDDGIRFKVVLAIQEDDE